MTILDIARRFWHRSQRHREPYATMWTLNYDLKSRPRFVPGEVEIGQRTVAYLDALTLQKMWHLQFSMRYNDFYTTQPAPRILDCGANIGVSVLRFKTLYPQSRITAFEPDKVISGVLAQNVTRNNLSDVEVVQAAVWTERTTLQFASYAGSDSQSGHIDGVLHDRPEAERLTDVPAIALRDYLNEPIDFLKLDIEGAEYAVLEDCAPQLGNIRQMMIELHYRVDEPGAMIRVLTLLKDAGFRIALYQPTQLASHKAYTRRPGAFADQFPVLWAWSP